MNKVITLSYELSTVNEDGTESFVEKTNAQQPFVFMSGTGGVLPDFENNLASKAIGEAFDFILKSENAYGPISNEYIIDIPVNAFMGEDNKIEEGLLKIGNVIPMADNHGNHMQGIVRKVGVENVTMDFNHPLAGKSLHFKGIINEVREATQDEISHGHVHGPGGHHH